MAKSERQEQPQTCTWTGASGTTYTYYIEPVDFDFAEDQDGNYIFAKVVGGYWSPVYIGQGDLKDRTKAQLDDGCVTRKGATHIHAHTNASRQSRLAEERDLLANYPDAYAPTGCNQKVGG